jgi:hypothetical protein
MEQAAGAQEIRRAGEYTSVPRSVAQFLLHLAIVYLLAKFTVLWLSSVTHNVILPLLRLPSQEGRIEFAFNHLALFSMLCGIIFGLVAGTYKHRAAQLVWIVPVIILTYRFVTFPASVFENHFDVAFHHYFARGFLIAEAHDYSELFGGWNSDYVRGLDQLTYTVPVYVSIAYGFATWVGARLGIRLPLLGVPQRVKIDGVTNGGD